MEQAAVDRDHLGSERIAERWKDVSASLSRLMLWMDSRESWVGEVDEDFIGLLAMLIERVGDPLFARSLEVGDNAARLAEVCAALHSSRFLRVLEMLDKRAPGIVSRFTLSLGRLGGESEVFANLFYERLMVIHRCELLTQIFSPRRSQAIAQSIQLIRGTE